MDYQLSGKRAFISGSSKGIGKATAELLHREGAEVILHGRTEASIEQALLDIPNARAVVGDLGNKNETDKIIEQLKDIGDIEILINNAGIYETKPFFDIPDEDWLKLFEINVMSGVRLARALMPAMLLRNYGRIIFVSSESAINIPQEMIHYGMTKTAQLAVSRGLAELTKGTEVTVNAVLPGPTASEGLTGMVEEFTRSKGMDQKTFEKEVFFKRSRPSSLIQRFADPFEVAQFITFVASPLSSAINGAALRVDGGVVKAAF